MQQLFFILAHLLVALGLPSTTAGVVYYVKPTEPCAHNSSCPFNETCHTMDHYASNSRHYFSPDHINVTLYFMCGVHNCTQQMAINDLQTFAMIGNAERENVTLNMPIPTDATFSTEQSKYSYQQFYAYKNICNVTIKNISTSYISVTFEGKQLIAKNAHFYGQIKFTLQNNMSVINITGSYALFVNCTFQENSFLRYQSNAVITLRDCYVHSFNHVLYSAIFGLNSTLSLLGSVYFINNSVGSPVSHPAACGAALFLTNTVLNPGIRIHKFTGSFLNINDEASVHFINNTADCGGAIFLQSTVVSINNKANITFCKNKARNQHKVDTGHYVLGGAILLHNSSITIEVSVRIHFKNNIARGEGGAICLIYESSMSVKSHSMVFFTINFAIIGGAVFASSSSISISDATVHFSNNIATKGSGGAVYICANSQLSIEKSIMLIESNLANSYAGGGIYLHNSKLEFMEHSEVYFKDNCASLKGGAIYKSSTGNISICSYSRIRFVNNSASQGGALYLPASATINVGKDSVVIFTKNTASDRGGAVYANVQLDLPCFLILSTFTSAVVFQGNVAKIGIGMDVYGASVRSSECSVLSKTVKTLSYCGKDLVNITFTPQLHTSVSSDPKRVCLCNSYGDSKCATLSKILNFVNGIKVYSGESFNLSLVVVGHDFGFTMGTIHANLMHKNGRQSVDNSHHWLSEAKCSNVTYTIISAKKYEMLYLQTRTDIVKWYGNRNLLKQSIVKYNSHKDHGCLDENLLTSPVYVNISILPGCPQGFKFDKHKKCACFHILKNNQIKCYIRNNRGYLEWNNTLWVTAENDTIKISQHCPLDYCSSVNKIVNLASNPDTQCDFNHAGTICGGCKDHYSLAIGSSRCIQCKSNSYISFFLFFIAAGIVLVIFILALNLTVTQGLINGVILYANLLWTYKDVLFPSERTSLIAFFQIFIAWLNLDFGIETCLVDGLTAFWKTWLQFLFPLYIWLIAGVIIIVCRYSSRLTNLIGDRAVPLLATLFLLSYTKLLRTLKSIFEFGVLTHYPNKSKSIVWYIDGNLSYGQHPHIYLLAVAIITLILCLSFTQFLLLIQWWRKISHLRLLRWINKLTPFYDAYFAPLKDKHHYWFGTLLLVRIVLLISFTATSSTSPFVGLLFLQFTLAVLCFYLSILHAHKSKIVLTIESTSILNLIILVGFTLHTGDKQVIFLEISIAFSFIQFTAIVVISLFKIFYKMSRSKCVRRNGYQLLIHQDTDSSDEMVHERVEDPEIIEQNMHNLRNTVDTY